MWYTLKFLFLYIEVNTVFTLELSYESIRWNVTSKSTSWQGFTPFAWEVTKVFKGQQSGGRAPRHRSKAQGRPAQIHPFFPQKQAYGPA